MRTKKIMAINVRKYSYSCELVTQNEIDYMRTCRLWLHTGDYIVAENIVAENGNYSRL